jgi:hypothetical protein
MRVAQALDALRGLLETSWDGVQVVYGGRDSTQTVGPAVYFVGDARGSIDQLTFDMPLSDTYDIDVTASASRGAGEQLDAMTVAVAMFEAAVTAIQGSGNLGVPGVLNVQPIGSWRLANVPSPKGRDAAVSFTVRVQEDYS